MSRKEEKSRADIYARITDRIVADLERGVRPWTQPWTVANTAGRITRPLRYNGQPYSGVNVILLWSEAVARGFSSPIWMTFKQAAELGGHVRKGETGSIVVYASRFTKTETDGNGDEVERDIPFLKAYTVFCVDQIDDLPEALLRPAGDCLNADRTQRARRRVLCQHRRRRPTWRHDGVLCALLRSRPDAADRKFSRRGRPMSPSERMKPFTGPLLPTASIEISAGTARIVANARARN